ncbi:MAG: LacI family DNA-binding transcriptional regulator [Eubacteriales bacterium]|nr:LacI family DNA-binding transcriptional regulator [Eubacteriales bacterium]
MDEKKITIKKIADMADVSIATVSHVINRTRYVSPELVDKIEKIIVETGYDQKLEKKKGNIRLGNQSIIVAIFPTLESAIYRDMVSYMRELIVEQGYQFFVAVTKENHNQESTILEGLIRNKLTAGIILAPVKSEREAYQNLMKSTIPFVCVERIINNENIDMVLFQDMQSLYDATKYLLKSGHTNILFIRESIESISREERTRGYLKALKSEGIHENDANITEVNLRDPEEKCRSVIQRALQRIQPTAVIAGGNRLTMHLMKVLQMCGIECPDQISVIGFGDETWSELMYPPLTTIDRDVQGLSTLAVKKLMEKINTGNSITKKNFANVTLNIRKSTRMLDNGPLGEKAASPEDIVFSQEEKTILKKGNFKVAISFHYTGTAWAEMHEKGIRDELDKFGINLVSVMDAHFDPELQNMQLDAIQIQKPDAVIAIPADDRLTAEKFRGLSKITKLIFLSNIPDSIENNDYVSCISVNEWENGTNAGRLMGEYFADNRTTKVGFIVHGAAFYGTKARDSAAQKIVTEKYTNLDIVSVKGFGRIENAYQTAKDMLQQHPDIQGLYVSWDQPALKVIKALEELKRKDIVIFTTDLDYEIAKYVEAGYVQGLSTQRPYEQGRAAALAVAKSLVSSCVPKYLAVQPYIVNGNQLKRAWKDIFHEPFPDDSKNLRKY